MRWRSPVRALQGHLLFAEIGSDSAVLDCVLEPSDRDSAGLATFFVEFPGKASSNETAKQLLRGWTDDDVSVSVTMSQRRGVPQVEIASERARLVLTVAA